jgi:hypothetical protein
MRLSRAFLPVCLLLCLLCTATLKERVHVFLLIGIAFSVDRISVFTPNLNLLRSMVDSGRPYQLLVRVECVERVGSVIYATQCFMKFYFTFAPPFLGLEIATKVARRDPHYLLGSHSHSHLTRPVVDDSHQVRLTHTS